MGVPGFFLYILKNRELKQSILLELMDKSVDYLYLDFNSVIHNAARSVRMREENKNWKSKDSLEELIILETIQKFNEIVEFASPSKYVYIAIDGPCPLGKVLQQRERRIRTVEDSIITDKIMERNNISTLKYWPSSSISPGTKFMFKLESHLRKEIMHKKNNNLNTYKDVVFKLSGSNEEGEGENKIMANIKNNSECSDKCRICIYGLDADLLFLSLLEKKKKVYLMRENIMNEDAFTFVDIDILRKEIELKIKCKHVEDFVFLSFLLGNDFVEKVPTLSIYARGIPFIIDEYKRAKQGSFNDVLVATDRGYLNLGLLRNILEGLSKFESLYLKNQFRDFSTRKIPENEYFKSTYEKEMFIFENNIECKNDFVMDGRVIENDKIQYYKRYFSRNVQKDDICHSYLQNMWWCMNYYTLRNLSWEYVYPYEKSPFVSDMCSFLSRKKKIDFVFTKGEPLRPIEQLLIIIPEKDKRVVIDKRFLPVYADANIFGNRNEYKIDCNYVKKRFQVKLVLPEINLRLLRKEVRRTFVRQKTISAYLSYIY